LSQSAALTPLKDLLKAGMVFILISGNDARRTEERIKGCFGALGHRVLVCANGGADLMYYDKNKKLLPDPQLADDRYEKFLFSLVSGSVPDADKAHAEFYKLIKSFWGREFWPYTTYSLNGRL
jgi:hypothetical protein